MTTNAYTFLPWLRAGMNTKIEVDPGAAARASVPVSLTVSADALAGGTITAPVDRTVQLYGPGDVVGVDPRAISRTEPLPGLTNVEPNFLAHIEFAEEDFVWRYSPAPSGPTTGRLAPWLALVVLATATEFADAPGADPLPAIDVTDPAGTLPPPDQLGAWAHVHVHGALADPVVTDSTGSALAALDAVLHTDPDSACSRLICPRHLAPDTALRGVPGAGVRDGPARRSRPRPRRLTQRVCTRAGARTTRTARSRAACPTTTAGLFVPARPATSSSSSACSGRRQPTRRWAGGPSTCTSPPASACPASTDQGGVLPLGGALRVPEIVDPADNWDNIADAPPPAKPYPHPFEEALAGLINLADDYQRKSPAEAHAATPLSGPAAVLAVGPQDDGTGAGPDPIITPPLYGRWHSLTSRLLRDRDGTPLTAEESHNWVHRLNLDPRFRVAANLGTQVVRDHEEELMAAAWAQVGDVLVANGRIRAAQLAREVGHVLQTRHLDPPAGTTTAALAAAPAPSGRALTAHRAGPLACHDDGEPGGARQRCSTRRRGERGRGRLPRGHQPGRRGARVAGHAADHPPRLPADAHPRLPGGPACGRPAVPHGRPGRPGRRRPGQDHAGRARHPRGRRRRAAPGPAAARGSGRQPGAQPRLRTARARRPGHPASRNQRQRRGDPVQGRASRAAPRVRRGRRRSGGPARPPALDLAGTTAATLTGLRSDETVPSALLDGAVSLPAGCNRSPTRSPRRWPTRCSTCRRSSRCWTCRSTRSCRT